MAKTYKRRRPTSYSKKRRGNFSRTKRRTRRNDLTTLAYKMGQIERGRKNPDSQISESFNRGATAPQKRAKKTLF